MPSRRRNNNRGAKGGGLIKDVPTLMKMAQDNIDKMNAEGAIAYLEEALKQQPNNLDIVDKTANVYMELGEDEKAFPVMIDIPDNSQLLVKSAKEDPEHNFEKWMYLGQLQVFLK